MGYLLTMPTAFEWQLRRLGLNEQTCVKSIELQKWCERNKDRYYVPERLLKQWGMSVDPSFSAVSRASPKPFRPHIRLSVWRRHAAR